MTDVKHVRRNRIVIQRCLACKGLGVRKLRRKSVPCKKCLGRGYIYTEARRRRLKNEPEAANDKAGRVVAVLQSDGPKLGYVLNDRAAVLHEGQLDGVDRITLFYPVALENQERIFIPANKMRCSLRFGTKLLKRRMNA